VKPDGSRPPHHGPDGRFRNPPGSPRRAASGREHWAFLWGRVRDRRRQVAVPDGHVLRPEQVAAGLARHRAGDSLTWIGHACFLLRLGGVTVLTDPYLSPHAGPWGFGPRRYVQPALTPATLPPVDLVLLSHNHYDHLDAAALRALAASGCRRAVVPLGLGGMLRRLGFIEIEELDWWQETQRGGLRLGCLPAVHFSRRGLFDRNRSLWASFALEAGGTRLYFAGDTAHGRVFRQIGAQSGPFDLAMVGIGAYAPLPVLQASHTTPEEAVLLSRELGARRVAAMHWGTVALSEEPQFEPPERFRAAAAAAGYAAGDTWIMAIGETRPLGAPWPANG